MQRFTVNVYQVGTKMTNNTVTKIRLDLRELADINTILAEQPDTHWFTLIHTDTHNGIGSCLDLEIPTKINNRHAVVTFPITDETHW